MNENENENEGDSDLLYESNKSFQVNNKNFDKILENIEPLQIDELQVDRSDY